MISLHPRLRFWTELAELLLMIGEANVRAYWPAPGNPTRRRKRPYKTIRPGPRTPMWNLCCTILRNELRPWGSKVRLARYLGIPKQRISDFLAGRRRMPDAETMLQMLHWAAAKRAGKDHSI
jgi:hypothetical protein